jgi:hypothetical protein
MDKNKHVIVWEGTDAKSMECLSWQRTEENVIISSNITGVSGDIPFSIHYMLETDFNWTVKHLLVNDLLNTQNNIQLSSDGKGRWFHGTELLSMAEGCIDADLTLTPFTNTLPIRRLSWEQGKRQTIQVIHIGLPEMKMVRAEQYYTMLSPQRFLFETGDHFSAELSLDENKMVIHYPGIAKKIFPR